MTTFADDFRREAARAALSISVMSIPVVVLQLLEHPRYPSVMIGGFFFCQHVFQQPGPRIINRPTARRVCIASVLGLVGGLLFFVVVSR